MGLLRLLGAKRERSQSISAFYRSLYPSDVRYALSYREAKMRATEIASLIDRFTYEAMYLIVKIMEDREKKRDYIEKLTHIFIQPDYQVDDLKKYLYSLISTIPADAEVSGTKLAQLSRYGMENWQTAFRGLAEDCYRENPTALPCLIAHTTIMGFHHFVQIYSQVPQANIMLLVPEWMMDETEEMMGYGVELNPEPKAVLRIKDVCLVGKWACMGVNCRLGHRYCGNALFIDDTIHTGKTSKKISNFWSSEYGLKIEGDRIRVITDLRS